MRDYKHYHSPGKRREPMPVLFGGVIGLSAGLLLSFLYLKIVVPDAHVPADCGSRGVPANGGGIDARATGKPAEVERVPRAKPDFIFYMELQRMGAGAPPPEVRAPVAQPSKADALREATHTRSPAVPLETY